MLNAHLIALSGLVEDEAHEVDLALSWGIGGLSLAVLVGLLIALAAFGGGREHS